MIALLWLILWWL